MSVRIWWGFSYLFVGFWCVIFFFMRISQSKWTFLFLLMAIFPLLFFIFFVHPFPIFYLLTKENKQTNKHKQTNKGIIKLCWYFIYYIHICLANLFWLYLLPLYHIFGCIFCVYLLLLAGFFTSTGGLWYCLISFFVEFSVNFSVVGETLLNYFFNLTDIPQIDSQTPL